MRVIRLDGSDVSKQAWVHIFQAMRAGSAEGNDQVRRVGKMLDKIEAAGVSKGEGDGQTWELKDGGAEIWLEGAEWNELKNQLATVKWPKALSREVIHTLDIVEGAKEEDPSKPRVMPDEQAVETQG